MKSRWLRLIRIHTASLTQGVVLLGLMLTNHWTWIHFGAFVLFGILFHAAGFIDNDIHDFKYDRDDNSKQHFPLVSGEISLKQAKRVYFGLTLITLLLGLILSNLKLGAIIFLFTAFVFGHIYNRRCKQDLFSPFYITASLISLPLFSYFSLSEVTTAAIVWTVLYIAFLMLFQSSIEGTMKDIGSDKVSLIKTLGTNIDSVDSIHVSFKTKILAWSLKIPAFIIFAVVLHLVQTDLICLILGLAMILTTAWAVYRLIKSGYYDHHRRVRLCAIIEVFTYTLIVIGLQGVLGWWIMIILIFYPYFWYLILNQLTWGTWITPRV